LVLSATFNNISLISWRSVELVEETRVSGSGIPSICCKSQINQIYVTELDIMLKKFLNIYLLIEWYRKYSLKATDILQLNTILIKKLNILTHCNNKALIKCQYQERSTTSLDVDHLQMPKSIYILFFEKYINI
jgi:hypothetical protein